VRDDLLTYYERELSFLRQMGTEFAERYPKIASRLALERTRCEDPHVERLLEGFALLAARLHLKIDDDFPEISEALLGVIYPHFVRPVPSMSVVEFQLDPERGRLTGGIAIPRGSMLYTRPVAGFACQFQTAYDTELWPVEVTEAQWTTPDRLQPAIKSDAAAALRIRLKASGDAPLASLGLRRLRFYLNAESAQAHLLYELLANNCQSILLREESAKLRRKTVPLPPESLHPVGFEENEGILPHPRRSFAGYRLLAEYFAFPDKFFFLDVSNLEVLQSAEFATEADLIFLISPFALPERAQALETSISPSTLRLGCAPVVNLFPQTAEPILVDQKRHEYAVVPDVRRQGELEVFSIEEVVSVAPHSSESSVLRPYYSYRHSLSRDRNPTYWYAARRPPVARTSEATEVLLSLVDLSGRPARPEFETLTVRTMATNGDLPSRLPFGNPDGDFELEGSAPVARIVALRKPTVTLRPPVGKPALWRLVSHLSLNYLSLVEEGREALQHLLKLYDFSGSAYLNRQIDGIVKMESRRHFARVVSENGIAFVRGVRVDMELDEDQFVGGGPFLFAAVLERFLGLYASLNSFSQLGVSTVQRKGVLREWPPRAGQAILM
jgi:type VI secretion system protein ImpG